MSRARALPSIAWTTVRRAAERWASNASIWAGAPSISGACSIGSAVARSLRGIRNTHSVVVNPRDAGTSEPSNDILVCPLCGAQAERPDPPTSWAAGIGAVIITIDGSGHDALARLDRDTFRALPMAGPWGFRLVRGLVELPTGLVGVSEGGDEIDIDPAHGSGQLRAHVPQILFGGATDW